MEGFFFFFKRDQFRGSEDDSRFERRLPSWARRRHPVLAWERHWLPALRIRRPGWWPEPHDAPIRALFYQIGFSLTPLVVAYLALVVLPFQLSLVLLLFALTLLHWLPLLWAAPVISREVTARRWDALRATPYSTREIVLAKLSAVGRHLLLVLRLALVVQLIPVLVNLFELIFGSAFSGLYGLPLRVVIIVSLPLLTVCTTLLDYSVNIAIGGLASTVTRSRNTAYLGALGLRAGLSLLYMLAVLTLADLPARGAALTKPVDLMVLAGPPAWTVALLLEHDPLAALVTVLLTVGGQVAILATLVGLTARRAVQLGDRAA